MYADSLQYDEHKKL